MSWSASSWKERSGPSWHCLSGSSLPCANPWQHYASLQRYQSYRNEIVSLSGHVTPQTNVCTVHQLWKWDIPLRLSETQHSTDVLWTRKAQLTEPTGEIVWEFRISSALCTSLWKYLPLGPQHLLEVSNHRYSDTEFFVCMPINTKEQPSRTQHNSNKTVLVKAFRFQFTKTFSFCWLACVWGLPAGRQD